MEQDHQKEEKKKSRPDFSALTNIWPLALAACLVFTSSSALTPKLEEIPELLTPVVKAADDEQESGEEQEKKEDSEEDEENVSASLTSAAASEEALVQEAFQAPAAGYQDGVYTGSAQGFGGAITLNVTISGGRITAVTVIDASGETPAFWSKAVVLTDRIVAAQSPNVDTVSGATYSSTGIKNAAKRALAQAAVNGGTGEDLTVTAEIASPESGSTSGGQTVSEAILNPSTAEITADPEEIAAEPEVLYADGTYEGTGEGFGGDVVCEVTVSNHKITGVKILSAEDETPSYLARASVVIPAVVEKQSPEVDTVSGATYSSRGILDAVTEALGKSQAEAETQKKQVAAVNPGKNTGSANPTKPEETVSPSDPEDPGDVPETEDPADPSDPEKTGDEEDPENPGSEEDPEKTGDEEDPENPGSEEDPENPGSEENPADPSESDPSGSGESGESGEEETEDSLYADGVYTVVVNCTDNDIFCYDLAIALTVEDGKIISVEAEKENDLSDEPDDNDTFIGYALSGRTRRGVTYPGIPEQVIAKQSAEELDVVSSATYSSNALIKGAAEALQEASEAKKKQAGDAQIPSEDNQEDAEVPSETAENREEDPES